MANFTSNIVNLGNATSCSNPNFSTAQSREKLATNKPPAPGLMDMSGRFNNFRNRPSSFPPAAQKTASNASRGSFQSSSYNGQQTSSFSNTAKGRGYGTGAFQSHQAADQNRMSQGRGQLKLNNFSSPHPQGGQPTLRNYNSGFNTNRPNNIPRGRWNTNESQTWGGSMATSSAGFSGSKQTPFKPSASKIPNQSSTTQTLTAHTSMMQGGSQGYLSENSSSNIAGRPGQFASNGNFISGKTSNASGVFSFEDENVFDNKKKIATQSQKTTKKDADKPAENTSLRIFTCPIATLKSWVGFKVYSGPVMFEVYGLLDSATVKDPTGTGKEFMLRDDTDSIKCVFFEIDRELPRLTRGQVHRVVGVADKRRGLLQAVCVRPAQKDERRVCQAAGALSQAEMEHLVTKANEQ
ncbi:spermatogenesis-associated protein 22 [Elysia marginata]|uniref:Spermatogenesis-associated protein 22 n=1 Tax=Elysia marginata TaxID=1093978 RepID=A0AAV4G470_9GAST|nr:spermatogenesis-associated protein 22 [Elysia marginata]